MKKKNILITGANGLLGRYLVEILSQKHIVFAIVRNKKKLQFKLNKNISVLEMDLNKINTKVLPSKIDTIYYLAQSNQYKKFPKGIDDMIFINVYVPNILAKWATKNKVKKFIYASSGGVYGGSTYPLKESSQVQADTNLGFYLNTKISGEMLLKNYLNKFMSIIIIRPFFIYGLGQKKDRLFPQLISNIKNNKEINIDGKDGIKLNPIYATDAAKALANILNVKNIFTINIAGDQTLTLRELLFMIGDELGKKPIIKNNKYTKNGLVADTKLMREKLFIPKVDLKTGINKMLNKFINDKY